MNIKVFVLVLILLLLSPFIVGFFLSKRWEVTATTRIEAQSATLRTLIAAPNNWRLWVRGLAEQDSFEFNKDPKNVERSRPGKGAWLSWKSQKLGDGRVVIVDERVVGTETVLKYEFSRLVADQVDHGTITLTKLNDQYTEVKWMITGESSGNGPLDGFMALLTEATMQQNLQNNLKQLATVATSEDPMEVNAASRMGKDDRTSSAK